MSPREFAIEVVKTLQAAGHHALWAGGCVRDQLLDRTPKDYDVATSALPDVVREVFGKRRTLPIGASFGVITVLGPKGVDPIEVATFRRDGGYSDGRRPDEVEYTDAREDAIRRDFTINGMFFDPIKQEVIDYVGGKDDLAAKMIRAIGDPHARIEEDKLRMLRGIRFASTFEFDLEPETLAAIQTHAAEIGAVSHERIGAEMRRMLASPNRAIAVRLLRESKLLVEILPSAELLFESDEKWNATCQALASLTRKEFESAAAVLLDPIVHARGVDEIVERWKLSNDEKKSIQWICKHRETLEIADTLAWSKVQPLLLNNEVERTLLASDAIHGGNESLPGVAFCRERLGWDRERLNPMGSSRDRSLSRSLMLFEMRSWMVRSILSLKPN